MKFIGYSVDALTITDNSITLRSDFDPARHHVQFDISDDEPRQTVDVTTMSGILIASGTISGDDYFTLNAPLSGTDIEVLEVDGAVAGYLASTDLTPCICYRIGRKNLTTAPGTSIAPDISAVAGFGPGTLISTTDGELPIDWLEQGDRVITRDHGARPIRWIGQIKLDNTSAQFDPSLWPVTISENRFGPGAPNAPTIVSPQHRVLMAGWDVEFLFGRPEVFVTAAQISPANKPALSDHVTTFYYILLDAHEVILANGLWTESLLSTDAGNVAKANGQSPSLQHDGLARPSLHDFEVSVLEAFRENRHKKPLNAGAQQKRKIRVA